MARATTAGEFAALVKKAEVVITNNTLTMHLARTLI
jgi:ADP-heptose:LPS heptosyltransferase